MLQDWKFLGALAARAGREPLVHFFLVGALLFSAQHWLAGDARTIVVTRGVRRELERRFEDTQGRAPSAAELDAELRAWKHDEALFREALRLRLDRDDPTIRTVLVDKMKALAAFEVPERAPSDAELADWLVSHRDRYELPLRYDFELIRFPRSESDAQGELERFERAVQAGQSPASLGRSVTGGELSAAEMQGRLTPELVALLPTLPPGQWRRAESTDALWLVRVKRVAGGLPRVEERRAALVADWTFATREAAIERVLQETVARYQFEEQK